jgi:predicted amidohydrolase
MSEGINGVTQLMLKAWLAWRLRDEPPHSSPGSDPWAPMPVDRVKIGAVQWNATPVKRAQDWLDRVEHLFREAQRAHCHLLVFPEYIALSLLGVIMPEDQSAQVLTDETIRTLLRTLGPVTYRYWYRWMRWMSRQYRMVTVAGSALTVVRHQLVNATVIFNAEGEECLWQPKFHPMAAERRWGVSPGAERMARPYRPWGLTAVVCHDATYFETFRMAEALGARIVAVPIADPEVRYTEGKARRGCFSRVQDVPVIGVVAANTGQLFGVRLTGKAGIYVPAPLSFDGSGVLAESPHPHGEGLITAVISLSQLEAYRRQHEAQFPMPPASFLDALYQFEGPTSG